MKNNLYIMYALSFLQGMVFYAPVAAIYRLNRGLSVPAMTFLESLSWFLGIMMEVPLGVISEKIGYRRTMILCCSVSFVSKVVFRMAEGFGGFFAERILVSVVTAGMSGVDISILYLSSRDDDSQKVFGIFGACGTAGLLLSAVLYSVLPGMNEKTAADLTVITYGAAALLSLLLKEVREKRRQTMTAAEMQALARRLFRSRRTCAVLAASALFSATYQTVTVFLNQVKYTECGMNGQAIGLVYIAASFCGMSGIFSHRFTKRFRVRNTGIILMILPVVSCAVLSFSDNAFFSVSAVLLMEIGFGLYQPYLEELQNRMTESGDRAAELSMQSVFSGMICSVVSAASGLFAGISLNAAFWFGAVICICGTLLLEEAVRG